MVLVYLLILLCDCQRIMILDVTLKSKNLFDEMMMKVSRL